MTPAAITTVQAETRLKEVRDLARSGFPSDAEEERQQLFIDVLFTIAHAPGMAYKSELKRLAAIALDAHDVEIPKR